MDKLFNLPSRSWPKTTSHSDSLSAIVMARNSVISEPPRGAGGVAVLPSKETKPDLGFENSGPIGLSSPAVEEFPEYYRRVLNSQELMRSGRLRVLLAYMLKAVESGAAESLTERSIGIEVFGRENDWDPSIDPCVRVAIGRLRTKLKFYYENFGQNDSTKVILGKGSYAPQIVHSEPLVAEIPLTSPFNYPIPQSASGTSYRQITRGPALYLFLSVFLISVVLLGIYLKSRSSGNRAVERFEITPFSTDAGAQFSPAISPDGSKIAYVWDNNRGDFHIFVRPVAGGEASQIPGGSGGDFYPSWSPDGSRLAFLRTDAWEGKLVLVPAAGGEQKVVGSVSTAHGRWTEDSGPLLGEPGPVWSPDGSELIALDQGHFGIYAIAISSGQRRQLTFDTETTRDFYPRVSPDGQWLAFTRYTSHGVGDVFVLPLKGGSEPRQLTHDQRTIRGLSWTPDGRTLTMASNRTGPYELWNVDVQNGEIDPVPADTASAADPAIASLGGWLAFDNLHEVISVNRVALADLTRQGSLQPLVKSLGRDRWAVRSPDDTKIAFASDRSGTWQIWLANAQGGSANQLTHLQSSMLGSIAWSPDNRHLVFDGRPSGHSAIYSLDTTTGVSNLLLPNGAAEERMPYFSPDGKQLYFSSDKDGSVALYRLAMDSGQISLLAHDGFRAQASQDGKWVYFSTMFETLWRVSAHGGIPTQLPPALQTYSSATWTVVGNDPVILRKPNAPGTINVVEADSSLRPKSSWAITLPSQTEVLSVRSSGTGRELLLDLQEQMTSDIVLRKKLGTN